MVGLKVSVMLRHNGWQRPVKSGKTAGANTKQGLRMLKVKLTNLGNLSGSVSYKTYVTGTGWTKYAKNGKASGSKVRALTAMRIRLKGKVAKKYDVYYRTYFKGYGWLGWAKNGQSSGTTDQFGYVSAVQVKLTPKGSGFKGDGKARFVKDRWQAIELKYRDNPNVNQILEVKHTRGSKAQVVLRAKSGKKWNTLVKCKGYVGSEGIGQAYEEVARTPSGDFEITDAFGIKDDPGAQINYVKVTDDMYWCSDREHYNELIDIDVNPHNCTGEHLIEYSPHYDYGLFFDYNTNPVRLGRGSAFFVHCTGGDTYTGGCVAVSRNNMVKIIQNVTQGARICIYDA